MADRSTAWMWLVAAGALALLLAPGAVAAEKPARFTLDDVAWIAGGWQGEAFGSSAEEWWTPPSGGVMQGAFRLFRGERTTLMEFLTIRQTDSGVELRFYHYDPQMVARESEPLQFDLVQVGEGRAVFDSSVQDRPGRMVYSLTDEGGLVVHVENRGEDGEVDEAFDVRLQRVP